MVVWLWAAKDCDNRQKEYCYTKRYVGKGARTRHLLAGLLVRGAVARASFCATMVREGVKHVRPSTAGLQERPVSVLKA